MAKLEKPVMIGEYVLLDFHRTDGGSEMTHYILAYTVQYPDGHDYNVMDGNGTAMVHAIGCRLCQSQKT